MQLKNVLYRANYFTQGNYTLVCCGQFQTVTDITMYIVQVIYNFFKFCIKIMKHSLQNYYKIVKKCHLDRQPINGS